MREWHWRDWHWRDWRLVQLNNHLLIANQSEERWVYR